MAASKTARTRAKHRQKRSERRRRRELAAVAGHDGGGHTTPAALPKMSDVLLEFAEPMLESVHDDPSIEGYRDVLRCASVIWNVLAMLDQEASRGGGALAERPRVIELTRLLDEAVGGLDDTGLALVDILRRRRQVLFPGERRIFVDVSAELRGDKVHISASSAPIQP
jgi:hypothetical protein